jgi:hypothetical protein
MCRGTVYVDCIHGVPQWKVVQLLCAFRYRYRMKRRVMPSNWHGLALVLQAHEETRRVGLSTRTLPVLEARSSGT